MKEFLEKLIGRLEELKSNPNEKTCRENILLAMQKNLTIYSAIEIVNQLAEEYQSRIMIDGQYCWQTCSATEHCKECNRLSNGDIDYYENYDVLAEEYNNGWIPCERELPKYTGEYNVTVVVASELGSFEEVTTLRFENTKGKEPKWVIPKDEIYRVIAWMELPEKYQKGSE